jgi:uncharacterized protein YkwD
MHRIASRLSLLAVALALAGCSSSPVGFTLSGEPGFYKKLDATTAKVDAVAARDMFSIYRVNHNLSRLTIDPALQQAAEEQVLAMARADRMSHEIGGTLMSRLNGRLDHTTAVENVSAGYHTLAEAFSGWRDSPPHRANMLNKNVTRMGIAAMYAPGSKYKVFWTLILAAPDDRRG